MKMFVMPVSTPRRQGIEARTIIPPKDGWKEQTYYIVDVAFSPDNVIHRTIFYTGFLNGNMEPAGYNAFWFHEEIMRYGNAYYLKAIDFIDMQIDGTDLL